MLEDAIMSIRRANAEALRRRAALLSRRRPIRQLDNKFASSRSSWAQKVLMGSNRGRCQGCAHTCHAQRGSNPTLLDHEPFDTVPFEGFEQDRVERETGSTPRVPILVSNSPSGLRPHGAPRNSV